MFAFCRTAQEAFLCGGLIIINDIIFIITLSSIMTPETSEGYALTVKLRCALLSFFIISYDPIGLLDLRGKECAECSKL